MSADLSQQRIELEDEEALVRRYSKSRQLLDGVVEVSLGADGASERIDALVLSIAG